MAAEESSRSDSVIYLTLVDFLIQLIFFSVFLFVAFYPSRTQDVPSMKPEFKKYGVPILEGFGELISAENVPLFQELAKFIRNRSDLIELVEALKRAGTVKQLLEGAKIIEGAGGAESARKRLGVGRPTCLKDKAPLMTVVAFDDYVEIASITERGHEIFEVLGINVEPMTRLSFSQFAERFQGFSHQEVEGEACTHFVRYERATKLEAPRLVVEKIFLFRR